MHRRLTSAYLRKGQQPAEVASIQPPASLPGGEKSLLDLERRKLSWEEERGRKVVAAHLGSSHPLCALRQPDRVWGPFSPSQENVLGDWRNRSSLTLDWGRATQPVSCP